MDSEYKDFVDKVTAKINDGWVLQGGVSVRTNEEGYPVFYQAITYTP